MMLLLGLVVLGVPVAIAFWLFWLFLGLAGGETLSSWWSTAREERRNRRAEQGLDPDGASYKPLTSKQWEDEFRKN